MSGLQSGTQVTMQGTAVGTPAYMAPEQGIDAAAVDHRADIYSLGALLYELLAGSTPFDSEMLHEVGYDELRREQAEKRERGELMGIGISFFTEAVGAGPRKDMDILGLGMADGCELRVHPTGKAVVRLSVKTQGQGHETTFAQIVADRLDIDVDAVEVVHGDQVVSRATVMQRKTGQPVRFEVTEQTRDAVQAWIAERKDVLSVMLSMAGAISGEMC